MIQGGKLTDWFIGLAQATSYELWLEACQAYAQQLIKEEEVVKGSSFLYVHRMKGRYIFDLYWLLIPSSCLFLRIV